MNQQTSHNQEPFPGFAVPRQNWFKLPNNWTDITARMHSWAEHKVVEYVLRHTWGFQEYGILKRITLDEFQHGRKRADGSRIDQGVGMGRQAIINGLRQAVQDGYLTEARNETDRARIRKSYAPRIAAPAQKSAKSRDRSQRYDNHTSGVRSSYPGGMTIIPRSEKDTQKDTLETVRGRNGILGHLDPQRHPKAKTEVLVGDMLAALGDQRSAAFYRSVAHRVPEPVIYRLLSEVAHDGARSPQKLFTFKVRKWAEAQKVM